MTPSFQRSCSGHHIALASSPSAHGTSLHVERTVLYKPKRGVPHNRPQSAPAHDVTSDEQRAKMMRAMGSTASDLLEDGISADDARKAGFEAAELLEAGYTREQLLAAGFAPNTLSAPTAHPLLQQASAASAAIGDAVTFATRSAAAASTSAVAGAAKVAAGAAKTVASAERAVVAAVEKAAAVPMAGKCPYCGKTGHWSSDCPEKGKDKDAAT